MADWVEQLPAAHREALQQFILLTGQPATRAIPFLQRASWKIEAAIEMYYGDQGPPPPGGAANPPDRAAGAHGQDQLIIDHIVGLRRARPASPAGSATASLGPAPRVHMANPNMARMCSWPVALVLAPFRIGWALAKIGCLPVLWAFSLAPSPIRRQLMWLLNLLGGGGESRRVMMATNAAVRFRREFEEEHCRGKPARDLLPFFEGSVTQAYDLARRDSKFLLIVVLSPEHEAAREFAAQTLMDPAVVEYIRDPAHRILLWGGSVQDPEPYQTSIKYDFTGFPAAAVVAYEQPSRPSSAAADPSSFIVKRFLGPTSPWILLQALDSVVARYGAEMESAEAGRAARRAATGMVQAQDQAFQRSLLNDRQRARARIEAERRASEASSRSQARARDLAKWRRKRASLLEAEPAADAPGVVHVALKLPAPDSGLVFDAAAAAGGPDRVVRRFSSSATIEDLYAFVECIGVDADAGHKDSVEAKGDKDDSDGHDSDHEHGVYEHKFRFQIATVLPRIVLQPSFTSKLGATIGSNRALVVEELSEDEEA